MDKYMDIKELSQYLTIKQATLYAWAAQEKIPRVKIHGLLRFRRDEIDQWVEGFRTQAPQPRARPRPRSGARDLDGLIASAKREGYTVRHGETRPKSSLIRKEGTDGAV